MTYDVAPGTQTSALISAIFTWSLSKFHCRSPTEQQQKLALVARQLRSQKFQHFGGVLRKTRPGQRQVQVPPSFYSVNYFPYAKKIYVDLPSVSNLCLFTQKTFPKGRNVTYLSMFGNYDI